MSVFFCVSSVLFKNCLGKILQHFVLIKACKMMLTCFILCLKSFLFWIIFIDLNVYWMWCKGFGWQCFFFVSEVSFENVAKVMGFTHAFENGEKCNCLFMSMCFVFFMCLVRLQVKMNVLWVKFDFNFLLKWWVLLIFLRMVKSAILCGCPCFLCLPLLFQNCLKKKSAAFTLERVLKR